MKSESEKEGWVCTQRGQSLRRRVPAGRPFWRAMQALHPLPAAGPAAAGVVRLVSDHEAEEGLDVLHLRTLLMLVQMLVLML